jgi:cell division protein FtsW (lipid II flippase)
MSIPSAALPARRHRGVRIGRFVPWLIETLLVLCAIVLLLPHFARVAANDRGRDQRFDDAGVWVQGLPTPALPAACAAHGGWAEPALRERLCGSHEAGTVPVAHVPLALADAMLRARQAFAEPVEKAQKRASELRLQQREGLGELRALADAIASLESETRPFVERFHLTQGGDNGPAPLRCATAWIDAALRPAVAADAAAQMPRANAVLLLAAALDGHGATEALARAAVLPPSPSPRPSTCGSDDLPSALGAAAALTGDTRQALVHEQKNAAMRELLRTAGWQWAGAMLLGLVLVQASRRIARPLMGVAASLAAWAVVGWVAAVPWPFAGHGAFQTARHEGAPWSLPAPFILVLLGVAFVLFIRAALQPAPPAAPPQAMSTRIGYPGLVMLTGLGWLLLLELSANGHPGNRYLALYHQGHLWLGMAVLSTGVFLRQPLARTTGWALSLAGETARAVRQRVGAWRALAALALATLALLAVFGLALSNMRQLTSELGRIWLIVGAAWFFFLRGGPLAEGLARSGSAARAALRYVWPMLFVVAVLIAAMVLTRDMGPLLIAGYASGAFLAASVAMWWHQRTGRTFSAFAGAVLLFAAWIALTTATLFKLGSIDSVTATRLESLAAPLASTNDQLALVAWFQQSAPRDGFGIGAVPWCGYAGGVRCGGVPAQIHSDYTFTAIVGVFGMAAAWMAAIGCAVWLHRLIRHHGRVTRGEPRFVASSGRLAHDAQAFLSWMAIAWVVLTSCQLAVTVAGNLAVLPLTGVTFPFVSFGMTSLLVNLAFLALAMNVDVPEGDGHV